MWGSDDLVPVREESLLEALGKALPHTRYIGKFDKDDRPVLRVEFNDTRCVKWLKSIEGRLSTKYQHIRFRALNVGDNKYLNMGFYRALEYECATDAELETLFWAVWKGVAMLSKTVEALRRRWRRFLHNFTPLYWLKYHTWRRHHVVNVTSKHDDYRWGWCDRDHLMLLACFKLLCDFVEQEVSAGIVDWDPPNDEYCNWDDIRNAKSEIDALYAWWTVTRPAALMLKARLGHRAVGEIRFTVSGNQFVAPSGECWDAYKLLDDAIDASEDEMLSRLLKIRRYLWT